MTFRLRDAYGDHGLVGFAAAHQEGGWLYIDSVVMSCRAMGYGMEMSMVNAVVREGLLRWPELLGAVGEFIPTARNGPARGIFAASGFCEGAAGWVWARSEPLAESPSWLSEEAR